MKKSIVFLFGFVLMGMGTLPAQQTMSLGNALNDIAGNLAAPLRPHLPEGVKIGGLPFNASFPALADYIPEQLNTKLTNQFYRTVTPMRDVKAAAGGFKLDTELTPKAAQDWGKRLQVGAVVFGSVRVSSSTYRLTATAIDVATGRQYWSGTYTLRNDQTLANLTKPAPAPTVPPMPTGPIVLDKAFELGSKGIEGTVKPGSKMVILNFTSPAETFSDYAVEELTGLLVRGKTTKEVRRKWSKVLPPRRR